MVRKSTALRFSRLVLASACCWAQTAYVAEVALEGRDFGLLVEDMLKEHSAALFGIEAPLARSAKPKELPYRSLEQTAAEQLLAAAPLRVEYLTRAAANKTDMLAFWPDDDDPDLLITCVEGDVQHLADTDGNPLAFTSGVPKLNPSIQRIDLDTGEVETIMRGMHHCDGIRRTPWGTILATEETSDGAAYEILFPSRVTNLTVLDRETGRIVRTDGKPARNVAVKRDSLPIMAWEGLAVLESGVVIAGDELPPGTAAPDTDGGAMFKFVPRHPRTGRRRIKSLSQSPLVAGKTYAMQVSCDDSEQQYGQGCEIGNGAWIEVMAEDARNQADLRGATGYYRPEDLHRDPTYVADAEHPDAVRFCWTNTGKEGTQHYAEVICGVDLYPLTANGERRTIVVNRFVEGDTDFNCHDNLAFQPSSGILYVVENHENGDIFACLPDGRDRDIKTDGCVKVLSVEDHSAEPTGFTFTGDGKTAYLSIQHSNDERMPLFDDYRTDDVLKITGFGLKDDGR